MGILDTLLSFGSTVGWQNIATVLVLIMVVGGYIARQLLLAKDAELRVKDGAIAEKDQQLLSKDEQIRVIQEKFSASKDNADYLDRKLKDCREESSDFLVEKLKKRESALKELIQQQEVEISSLGSELSDVRASANNNWQYATHLEDQIRSLSEQLSLNKTQARAFSEAASVLETAHDSDLGCVSLEIAERLLFMADEYKMFFMAIQVEVGTDRSNANRVIQLIRSSHRIQVREVSLSIGNRILSAYAPSGELLGDVVNPAAASVSSAEHRATLKAILEWPNKTWRMPDNRYSGENSYSFVDVEEVDIAYASGIFPDVLYLRVGCEAPASELIEWLMNERGGVAG